MEHAEGISLLLIGFALVISSAIWLFVWSWHIDPIWYRGAGRTDGGATGSVVSSLAWRDVWSIIRCEYPHTNPMVVMTAIVVEMVMMMWWAVYGRRHRGFFPTDQHAVSAMPDLLDRVARVWKAAWRYRSQSSPAWIDAAVFFGVIPTPVWVLAMIDRRVHAWSRRLSAPLQRFF